LINGDIKKNIIGLALHRPTVTHILAGVRIFVLIVIKGHGQSGGSSQTVSLERSANFATRLIAEKDFKKSCTPQVVATYRKLAGSFLKIGPRFTSNSHSLRQSAKAYWNANSLDECVPLRTV
jgi:hypothetical protein